MLGKAIGVAIRGNKVGEPSSVEVAVSAEPGSAARPQKRFSSLPDFDTIAVSVALPLPREPGEFMGQVDAKVGTVTGDAPITLSSTDRTLISAGSEEAGLWLWHGEAPTAPSLRQPKSRLEHILARTKPVVRWTGWITLPAGLALILLAASVKHSAPPLGPKSADAPAVALPPVPSPTVAPSRVAPPPAQFADTQFDQTRAPSAPESQISGRASDRPVVSWHPQRKSARTVRRTHASRFRRGPPMLIYGVLTPPVMTWHGGGY